MIELKGTLKERLDEAIRLAYTEVNEEELNHFRSIYEKAQIHLLPSAEAFYRQYGGVFRKHYMVLTNPIYNRDVYLSCYADFVNSRDPDPDMAPLRGLDDVMDFFEEVKDFAKQEICPVAQIGYYYPADVYVGENGLLYCVYEFQDEIEVFHSPSEIMESYLKNNIPVGIDTYPVKTTK